MRRTAIAVKGKECDDMKNYTRKTNRPKRSKHGGSLELRGNTYIARWMVNGKRFSATTGETDKAEAEKWLARKLANVRATDIKAKSKKQVETLQLQKAAQLDGAILQAERERDAALDNLPTVALAGIEAELRAVIENKVSENTAATYTRTVRQFVEWMGENHPEAEDANQVSEAMARQYFDHMAATRRADTHNVARVNLAHTWKILSERYRIKANPWKAIRPVKKDAAVRRTLTRDELARIAATLPGQYRTVFFVGCFTGLRLSDAATLEWEAIDLAAGSITLRPVKTARTSGRWVHLPIVPEFYAVLSAIPAEMRHGYVAPEIAEKYKTSRAWLSQEYTAYFRKAGVKTQTEDGDGKSDRKPARNVVGFHSLRHTFVSIAANAGVPFQIVQSIVGHSAAKMTEHYFHENREATALAFQKFPALFGGKTMPAALPNNGGDVIDAEVVEIGTVEPTAKRLAALDAAIADILANADGAEREAAAARLADAARELQKGANTGA